jgi:prepilin-type processing-associated H-X9-DG protein
MARVTADLRHRFLANGAAVAIYLVLAIAITWPLAINFDRVPADLADPLMSVWLLWWNATVMPLTDTWWNGLAFFPATDTLTLSDHRLGLGLMTTPLILGGAPPVAAYNLAFVASFVLSAAAAYWLCLVITGSRLAAFAGGLVFGFNPFRAGHLEHLELLSAYWLPVMLLALHTWHTTGRRRWLIGFAAAAVLQALTSGYYFVFSLVLVGLWALWFASRRASVTSLAALAAAVVAPMVVIAPILYRYQQAHQRMGLRRGITEIEALSADAVGLLTAPDRLLLWSSPAEWQRPEGAILPGALAVIVVAIACVVELRRRSSEQPPLLKRARPIISVLAAVAGFAALIPPLFGPVDLGVGPVHVSISDSFKPLTLAIVFLTLLAATSSSIRFWVRERSSLGFYVLATLAMWVLALGPTVRLLGEPVFYKAPYSWLMLLPGFSDAFRAPARFALLGALTLAVAAAVAFHQLMKHARPAARVVAAAGLAMGVMAESWIVPLPMLAAPKPLEIPHGVPHDAAIMEWPPGVYEDAAAMHRSTHHRRPIVNGLSGYVPPHYGALNAALADGHVEAIVPLAAFGDIAVFFDKSDPETPTDVAALAATTRATQLAETATHIVSLIARHSAEPPAGMPAAAKRDLTLESQTNAAALRYMIDGDYRTAWGLASGQSGDEQFTVDLGAPAMVGGVAIASGDRITLFARELAIDLSSDRTNWTPAWRGRFAAPSVAAALARPSRMDVSISFQATRARYVRVRQLGRSREPWAVAEFAVITAP